MTSLLKCIIFGVHLLKVNAEFVISLSHSYMNAIG